MDNENDVLNKESTPFLPDGAGAASQQHQSNSPQQQQSAGCEYLEVLRENECPPSVLLLENDGYEIPNHILLATAEAEAARKRSSSLSINDNNISKKKNNNNNNVNKVVKELNLLKNKSDDCESRRCK